MAYRKRQRPRRDPVTGVTYARQLREVPHEYLKLLGDGVPVGAFDVGFYAEENDPTCDPRFGGLANPTSMAAAGKVSVRTFVNSVVPSMEHCLHRVGPVVITTTNTVVPACRDYRAEQRAKQRQAGMQKVQNLIW